MGAGDRLPVEPGESLSKLASPLPQTFQQLQALRAVADVDCFYRSGAVGDT